MAEESEATEAPEGKEFDNTWLSQRPRHLWEAVYKKLPVETPQVAPTPVVVHESNTTQEESQTLLAGKVVRAPAQSTPPSLEEKSALSESQQLDQTQVYTEG